MNLAARNAGVTNIPQVSLPERAASISGRARRTRPGKGRCFPYLSTGPYHQLCGT